MTIFGGPSRLMAGVGNWAGHELLRRRIAGTGGADFFFAYLGMAILVSPLPLLPVSRGFRTDSYLLAEPAFDRSSAELPWCPLEENRRALGAAIGFLSPASAAAAFTSNLAEQGGLRWIAECSRLALWFTFEAPGRTLEARLLGP